MSRQRLNSVLSENEQNLDKVWEWYLFQGSLIGEEAVRTLEALLAGLPPSSPRYFAKTKDEINMLFDEQRHELSQVAMLVLLAAAEAALRVDYILRIIENKKDGVSKGFVALYKKQQLEVGLEDQLLRVWKRQPSATAARKSAMGDFRGALKLASLASARALLEAAVGTRVRSTGCVRHLRCVAQGHVDQVKREPARSGCDGRTTQFAYKPNDSVL